LAKKRIKLIKELCKGCGYCIEFCPNKVFERSEEITEKGVTPPTIKHHDRCTLCGLCTRLCPDFALTIEEEENNG
jgi:2-oxoglutarate ferredoxin oxidoreductase subunit delta